MKFQTSVEDTLLDVMAVTVERKLASACLCDA